MFPLLAEITQLRVTDDFYREIPVHGFSFDCVALDAVARYKIPGHIKGNDTEICANGNARMYFNVNARPHFPGKLLHGM